MICTVTYREVYGVKRCYPHPDCDVARLFLEIQGGRTLSDYTIERVKARGFKLEVKPQTI